MDVLAMKYCRHCFHNLGKTKAVHVGHSSNSLQELVWKHHLPHPPHDSLPSKFVPLQVLFEDI